MTNKSRMEPAVEVTELLQALIQCNSINPPGRELEVARLLAAWLRERNVSVTLQPFGDERANLVARFPGAGQCGALALCGHMDTVPTGTASWSFPPLGGAVAGERPYGRGAADMKGSLAAMAEALVQISRRADPLPGDVVLFATAGEEVDSCGARALVEQSAFRGTGALVVGEPTGLDVAVAHKGAMWVRVTVAGSTAHGSTPHLGSNAIVAAGDFVRALLEYRFEFRPHALFGGPTVSPNVIHGGIGANVVPDSCTVTVDMRTVPGMSHSAVRTE